MFSGVSLPFTSTEVLTESMGLIGVISSLIILAIALALTPQIISIIKGAIGRSRRA